MAKDRQYCCPEHGRKYSFVGKHGNFTPEQDAEIIAVYRNQADMKKGVAAVRDLAAKFGVPRWKVSRRAFSLGVVAKSVYSEDRQWTDAEIELLEKNAAFTSQNIWAKFKAAGYKRSQNSIVIKLKRLFGHKPTEGYACNLLAKLFGIDPHSITRWIEMGLLKAQHRGTARTSAQGGDSWVIQEADIRRFVIENVAIVDFRKADKFWLVELLTGMGEMKGEEGAQT
jgi:hypothetical protein